MILPRRSANEHNAKHPINHEPTCVLSGSKTRTCGSGLIEKSRPDMTTTPVYTHHLTAKKELK